MNRNKIAAGIAAATALIAVAAVPATQALAQFGGGRMGGRMGAPERRIPTIPWSFANSRPNLPSGRATGLFIWHDRNTVHVQTTDNHWFGDDIRGVVEIRGGTFDNVQSERGKADTRYHIIDDHRIAFHFNARDAEIDGFKFNIHDGNRLILHVGLDQRPTGRIYYGESKTDAGVDPVAFNLKK